MLVELIDDLGKPQPNLLTPDGELTAAEATIIKLRLDNEVMKHKHTEEIVEMKKNINTVLKDVQKSIAEEKERVIQDTRAACEVETIKRVDEAKMKQW